jgi:preprotein translocase SecE subunit
VVKVIDYIKSAHSEVKKVTWPSKAEAIRLTSYVIGVSLAVGLFVTIFDYVFKELLTILLIK